MSLHELTDDQREIRDLTRALRRREDRAARRAVGPRAPLPARAVHRARRARPDGRVRARGARRRGRGLPRLHARAGGALARRRGRRRDRRRAHERRHAADPQPRHARSRSTSSSRRWPSRRGARRVRADRVGQRAPTPARCAPASTDDRITGAKQWITNGSFASTFLVFAKEDDKPSRVPRPRRRRGLRASPARRRRWG